MVLHVHKERQQGRIDHPNSDQKVGCRFQSDLLIFFQTILKKLYNASTRSPLTTIYFFVSLRAFRSLLCVLRKLAKAYRFNNNQINIYSITKDFSQGTIRTPAYSHYACKFTIDMERILLMS